MNNEKSFLVRLVGLSLALGGLSWFFLWPEKTGLSPYYFQYLPKPWMVFSGVICAFIIFVCYLNWTSVSRRLLQSFIMLIIVLLLASASYFGSIVFFKLILGTTWSDLYSSLVATHGPHFGIGNIVGMFAVVIWLIGGVGAIFKAFMDNPPRRGGEFHQRGRQLITFGDAQTIAQQLKADNDPGIYWGMLNLPSDVATTHFLVTGATGSGKTITLRLLMQSVLPLVGKGHDCRALVYDAKQDSLSILAGMGLEWVVTLNPFDKRCAAWDIARDITGPAAAQQAASILIPVNRHESQPFFSDAARHLLTGVLITFIKTAPERWTLRDVVLAMRSKERLKQVLSTLPDTKDLLEYFANDHTAQNILSTLQSRMQCYEFIAAAWDRAEQKISLRDWLEGEFVLVLGNDEATRTALDAINQVIFKRLTELILALPESTTRRNWIFLDEVREAGELDGLGRLLTKGRSKGACVVLGFQDIDGLRDVYGTELANEIAGLCSNKAILRTDSSSTAEWASKLFGEREVLEIRQSTGESEGENTPAGRSGKSKSSGKSNSLQEQLHKRDVVMPSQIMDMLPTNPVNGLSGYYLTPAIGAYHAQISGNWIGGALWSPDYRVSNIELRAEADQYLSGWNDEDFRRLGIASKKQTTVDVERIDPADKAVQLPLEAKGLGFLSQIKRDL